MSTSYETVGGTKPDIDEQHEPRTIERRDDAGLHMMTEIGDGLFVQWSTCHKCHQQVGACEHPGGPVEPDYIGKWRTNRFKDSFTGRGAEPALPVELKQRDRAVDAVLRDLLSRGFTITPPSEEPTMPSEEVVLKSLEAVQARLKAEVEAGATEVVVDDLSNLQVEALQEILEREQVSLEECLRNGNHLTDVDEDGYCNFCGHQDNEDDEDEDDGDGHLVLNPEPADEAADPAPDARPEPTKSEEDPFDVGF